MPRGVKKRRSAAAESVDVQEYDADGTPVVSGEPSGEAPTIGDSIDAVRGALAPFDGVMRRRIVKAAEMLLK